MNMFDVRYRDVQPSDPALLGAGSMNSGLPPGHVSPANPLEQKLEVGASSCLNSWRPCERKPQLPDKLSSHQDRRGTLPRDHSILTLSKSCEANGRL